MDYEYRPLYQNSSEIILLDSFDFPILDNSGNHDLYYIKEGLSYFCDKMNKLSKNFKKMIIFGKTSFVVHEFLARFKNLEVMMGEKNIIASCISMKMS